MPPTIQVLVIKKGWEGVPVGGGGTGVNCAEATVQTASPTLKNTLIVDPPLKV